MRIKRLSFKNIGSYGNNLTVIDFPESAKVIGIIGENGNGKSFIQDAVCLALFGNPYRKIKKSELTNRINKNGLYVKLEIVVNNIEWTIERTLKDVKIFKSGKEIELDAHIVDIQQYINNNIIGVNEIIYRTTNLVSMRGFQSFFNFPKEKRRQMIESFFGIQILSVIKKLVAERNSSLTSEKNSLQKEIEILEHSLHNCKSNIRQIETNSDYKNEISKVEKEIKSVNKTITSLTKDKSKFDYNSLKNKEKEILNEKVEYKTELKTKEKELDKLNKEIEKIRDEENCPYCGHKISEREKEKKLNELYGTFSSLQFHIEENKKKIDESEKDFENVKADLDEYSKLEKKIDSNKVIAAELRKKLKFIESNSDNSIIDNLKKQKKEYEEGLQTAADKLDEAESDTEIIQTLQKVLSDEGIKKYIYSKFLPVLNNNINKILKIFEFNVHFELKDNLEEVIYNSCGDEISLGTMSNGEQQMVDVSFMFGVQQFLHQINSYNGNITFIDELFDASLDSSNLDKILNFLRRTGEQNIIITHKTQLKDSFDICYRVVKDNTFSKIYVE